MADIYSQSPSQYTPRPSGYSHLGTSSSVYPSPIAPPASAAHSSSGGSHGHSAPPPRNPKPPQKTQSTFLTKLYALLEKSENHHMIRWDPAGDHIIVERPEQLALHVLPSVYRQSRFASFSRQLNIYGFMRKVNLRNVDPAIDDPDASTWSHPTLNRHSPPEVVANFKRRVPPRLPKPRKRQEPEMQQIPPPRSAIGMGPVPLSVPSSLGSPGSKGRSRGFSAPGSFTPLSQGGAAGWGQSYPRNALPPLTVPSDPPMTHSSMYGLHPLSPAEEHSQSTAGFSPASYGSAGMQYGYTDSNSWGMSPSSAGSSSQQGTGSLSSLLNPSGNQYSRGSLQTSYPSPFSSVPLQNNHSASSLSPDSRPTTGYSVSSMSSLPYDTESTSTSMSHDYSRPGSGHHRPMSPSRPHSSHKSSLGGGLGGGISSGYSSSNTSYGIGVSGSAVRRQRRHSQAMSPYPNSPAAHGMHHSQRPSSSPQPAPLTPGAGDHHASQAHGGISRIRSMVQLPAVDTTPQTSAYTFSPGGDFAYSAGGASNGQGSPPLHASQGTGHLSSVDAMDWNRSVRPSTSASSLSAASHASSSQANTPPIDNGYAGEDINRCEC
ncbi:HSF-type DNA-binding-domain-containing protein [Phellopilus nigrolimitatus]|nr:HSF-type DNA-binding-domain-containing protein [Phellopilus nigrolimitatus]